MKTFVTLFIIVCSAFSLAGCQNMSKQDVGTMTGAVAGGLLGSQFGKGGGQILAIGAGTVAGALIGGSIGKSMDDTDRLKMSSTLENNPPGQPAYWKNSRTGTTYTVVPTKNITIEGNPYCREYRSTAVIAGKEQQVYGTACRQPDGTWKIMS